MNNYLLHIGAFEIDGDYIYTSSSNNNSIVRINTLSCEADVLFWSEADSLMQGMCWGKCARISDKILFAPCRGSRFCVYNLTNHALIDITPKGLEWSFLSDSSLKFWEVIACGGDFYVLGFQKGCYLRISADTYEFTYYGEVGELKRSEKISNPFYFSDGFACIEGRLYFPTGMKDELFVLNPVTGETTTIGFNNIIECVQSISAENRRIWVTDAEQNDKVLIFDIDTCFCEIINLPRKGTWYAPIFTEKYALLFPMIEDTETYRIDLVDKSVEVFSEIDDLLNEYDEYDLDALKRDNNISIKSHRALCVKKVGEELIIIRDRDYTWISYNLTSGEIKREQYKITDKENTNEIKRKFGDEYFGFAVNNNELLREDEMGLKDFLNRIKQMRK